MQWFPARSPARWSLYVALVAITASCHDAVSRSLAVPNDSLTASLARGPASPAAASPTPPTIYPTDGSYGWSFNGTTDSLRSGALTTSDLRTPFLAATDPASSGWLWAAGEGPGQINAAKRAYPVSVSVIGPSFFYTLPAARKRVYVRFMYEQSNPFNFDGTTSNRDSLTIVRFSNQSQQQIVSAAAAPGGAMIAAWNSSWTRSPSRSSTFNLNSGLGQWTCYEMMVDLTVRRQAHTTIWANGNVVLDNTITGRRVPSSTSSIRYLRFDGAINSMKSASTAWFALIGVSGQQMGCPPSSPPPPPPPPSSATQLGLTTQPSSAAQSGIAFPQQPLVQLRDSAGNAVSQADVVVSAAIASGGGTLGGTASVSTDSSGRAAFSNLSISGTVGARTLRFASGTLTTVVSSTVNLSAGPATQLSITMQPSSTAQSGVAFAQQPVVQLRDPANNAVSQSGMAVTATIASGGGSLGGVTTITTSTTGAATFTNLAITGSGAQTLQFAAPGLTTVTSAAINVSSGGTGGGTVLFSESFEDTNFGARGWYDLGGMTSLSSTDHITGSTHSLQINFPQGAMKPSPNANARHLFTPSDAVYVRYWIKHSSNWVGSGHNYHPHEFYILSTLDDQYAGPSFNYLATYIEDNWMSDGGHPLLQSQDAQNIDVTRINQDLTNVTENRAISGCNGNPDNTPEISCYQSGSDWNNVKVWRSAQPAFVNATGPTYKGDWHKVEAYYKLNSIVNGIGQRDGVAQYWVDGVLYIDRHDLMFRTGAHPTLQFKQLLMAPYIGDGSPVAQSLWYDDLVVMTAPPSP
ncbi:MAG TPA: hypothetical protein VGH98_19775 [Gemmatimonadaceae bacterium]|jgi:hypothetical protein